MQNFGIKDTSIAGPSRLSDGARDDLSAVFLEFESYPFSDDSTFKAGLPTVVNAIRGQGRSAAQIDEMIARAQWFYFMRIKGLTIPFEAYATYSQQPTIPQQGLRDDANGTVERDHTLAINQLTEARKMMLSDDESPVDPLKEGEHGLSFGMLCRLISEGRGHEVPGIVHIPDELNVRPKPWEKRPSPPGTSSLFTDPPLAPSPPTIDLDQLDRDVSMNLDDMVQKSNHYFSLPTPSLSHQVDDSNGNIGPGGSGRFDTGYGDRSHGISPGEDLAYILPDVGKSGDWDMLDSLDKLRVEPRSIKPVA